MTKDDIIKILENELQTKLWDRLPKCRNKYLLITSIGASNSKVNYIYIDSDDVDYLIDYWENELKHKFITTHDHMIVDVKNKKIYKLLSYCC